MKGKMFLWRKDDKADEVFACVRLPLIFPWSWNNGRAYWQASLLSHSSQHLLNDVSKETGVHQSSTETPRLRFVPGCSSQAGHRC